MITERRKLGDLGEEIAANYLKSKGYQILARNYQKPWGEIDIVAKLPTVSRETFANRGETLAFIEVKSQKVAVEALLPEENVHYFKKKRLEKAVLSYLAENKYPEETDWQIDVIAVEIDLKTRKADVRHIPNAF